jgi:hypothetical protein
LIAEPLGESLAQSLDHVWDSREQARNWGVAGRALYDNMDITWPGVVRKLLA